MPCKVHIIGILYACVVWKVIWSRKSYVFTCSISWILHIALASALNRSRYGTQVNTGKECRVKRTQCWNLILRSYIISSSTLVLHVLESSIMGRLHPVFFFLINLTFYQIMIAPLWIKMPGGYPSCTKGWGILDLLSKHEVLDSPCPSARVFTLTRCTSHA